jgi:hypothetical protein
MAWLIRSESARTSVPAAHRASPSIPARSRARLAHSDQILLRNRSEGQSFICLGAGPFQQGPHRHEVRRKAGSSTCGVFV